MQKKIEDLKLDHSSKEQTLAKQFEEEHEKSQRLYRVVEILKQQQTKQVENIANIRRSN